MGMLEYNIIIVNVDVLCLVDIGYFYSEMNFVMGVEYCYESYEIIVGEEGFYI